jgi:hypothetical protein
MTVSADRVRPIGRATPVDAQGMIVNPCHPDHIVAPWDDALVTALALIRSSLGAALHSVYLRGSIPRGTAIETVSDLDLVCVLEGVPRPPPRGWSSTIDARLRQRHPFCTGADVRGVSIERLMEPERSAALRFLLKTQALCIEGPDLTAAWDAVPLAHARMALKALPASLAAIRAFMQDASHRGAGERRPRCRWIAKKIIRAAFERVAERERAYTRDLYPCWEAASRHDPHKAAHLYQALLLAIEPEDTPAALEHLLQLGDWVASSPPWTNPAP